MHIKCSIIRWESFRFSIIVAFLLHAWSIILVSVQLIPIVISLPQSIVIFFSGFSFCIESLENSRTTKTTTGSWFVVSVVRRFIHIVITMRCTLFNWNSDGSTTIKQMNFSFSNPGLTLIVPRIGDVVVIVHRSAHVLLHQSTTPLSDVFCLFAYLCSLPMLLVSLVSWTMLCKEWQKRSCM
jgi:hypothetical protein